MSEDWKSEKAESSMREGTEAIRKAAEEKAKQQELAKWEDLKNELSVGNSQHKDAINIVIDLLKELYELPVRKD
jgi:hypothetical protein